MKSSSKSSLVVHVGVLGDHAGGISSVIKNYLAWGKDGFEIQAISTTTKKRDPLFFFHFVRAVFQLLRMARNKRQKNVVIVAHFSQFGSFIREGLVVRIAHFLGLRTVAHVHGSRFDDFAAKNPKIAIWGLQKADSILFLTTQSKKVFEQLAVADRKMKTHLVRNSIENFPLSNKPKSQKIIFAGEVGFRKGVDTLLEAWGDGSEFQGWELRICGPVAAEFSEIVENLQSNNTIVFDRQLPNSQIRELLSRSRVAVLPSRAEAQPIFILEALISECAVIASDVGEISSMLRDGAGLLIQPNSVMQLRQALSVLTSKPDVTESLARIGKQRAINEFGESAQRELMELWLED